MMPDIEYRRIRKLMGNRRFIKNLHISRKYNYIYVTNAKVASSTIKLLLSKAEMNDHEFSPSDLHNIEKLPLASPKDLSQNEQNILFSGSYYIFSFVRHPFTRVCSAYIDKILGKKRQKTDILMAMGKADAGIDYPVSFNDFIAVISDQDPAALNAHWRPQTINIAFGAINYDFIGHLETFNSDMKKIKTRLHLPDFDIPHRNKKSHNKPATLKISPVTRSRLENIYARDLQAFSYSSDIEI